nr:immunoglobulin light chain junction region [Macaca mulatta]MOW64473.1 immunoglobulin light chain junction region [Macaca mulatta]
CQKYSWPPYTF